MDLFRKKSVDQLVAESTPLKRTMRTFDLTMLGIGAIIGTGIFVLTGKGALTAGPALSVSFLLAAVCCGFAGLCYAEFAAMAPVSGSAYSYAYLAFGELIAFVIGWDLILEYALQAATVSAGWSGYFNKLLEGFGLHLPVELTAAYGTNPDVTTYFNLPGFVIVLIITWVLSIGINQTKRTNDVMVLIKLAIIVLFIVCAVWYVKPSNWQPFSPYGIYTFQPGSTQPYGIVPAASIVFFSFIGFDAVSSSAEETINPEQDAAARHPAVPGRFHRALHRHDHDHDRRGALQGVRQVHRRPSGRRDSGDRHELARGDREPRRPHRHDHGDARTAVRPVPYLLRHEP